MTTEDYKKLNDYLNIVFKYLEKNDPYLLKYIDFFCGLGENYLSFFRNKKIDEYVSKNNLSFNDVIELAKEIINTIEPNIAPNFDKLIEEGILNFDYENKDQNKCSVLCRLNENKLPEILQKSINVQRNYTFEDVTALVHEIFHFLNSDNVANKNREILTEFISIYFQNYAIDYIIKNKHLNEIFLFWRIVDTLYFANDFCKTDLILLSYEKIGPLNENTYQFLNEYYCQVSKSQFALECENLLNLFIKKEEEYKQDLHFNESHDEEELAVILAELFTKSYKYIFGASLAFYVRKNCSIEDVLNVHKRICETDCFEDVFEILKKNNININITDWASLIESCFEYYEEMKRLKPEMEVNNEDENRRI